MKIVIVGAGKMGSWLARCFAAEHEVMVFDREWERAAAVEGARGLSALSEVSAAQPELLINAVTLQETVPAFEEVLNSLPASCLLADIASVKGALPEFYARSNRPFVSVHPMFGPTFGDFEALRQENAIVIAESDEVGKHLFIELFARLGVRVFSYSFAEHDQMMAYSLTTPFASSLVFASCLTETAVPGTTFSRHRKIAQGLLSEDDHLLSEVLFNSHSLAQIERITQQLEFLKHVIRGRDFEEAARFFAKLRANLHRTNE